MTPLQRRSSTPWHRPSNRGASGGLRLPGASGALRWLVAAGLVFSAGACDLLESNLNPEEIRVVIESTTSGQLQLILSDDFFFEGGGEDQGVSLSVLTSDTVEVAVPYNQSYPLAPRYRFFVKVLADSAAAPRELSMRVLVDGDERYNKTGTLGPEDFEFVYTFN